MMRVQNHENPKIPQIGIFEISLEVSNYMEIFVRLRNPGYSSGIGETAKNPPLASCE